jgi:hypothetical protein
MDRRLNLYQLRKSRFPRVLGLCQDNIPEIAYYANSIQETLLFDKAAGDESWNGTWAEVFFNVSRSQPFITLPREIARIEYADVCNKPIELNNQFVEYLRFGNGRMVKDGCGSRRWGHHSTAGYERNNAILFTELTNTPQLIRAYINNAQDVGKRAIISGLDSNNKEIYSQDNLVIVQGQFMAFESPFVTWTLPFNKITGISKDTTAGEIEFYQVDPATGEEVLILTMQPSETIASYRRYYFNNLPCSCCPVPGSSEGTVQISAIAKLQPVPVTTDVDYLVLTSREAFIAEAQSLRLQEADTASAQQMAAIHHQRAIRLLISECSHYHGIQNPAVGFYPFGSPHCDTVALGMI